MKTLIAFLTVAIASSTAFANSSYLYCSAQGHHEVFEIKAGGTDMYQDEGIIYNGRQTVLLSSSDECGNDIDCNTAKGYPVKFQNGSLIQTMKIKHVKTLKSESWARGNWELFEAKIILKTEKGGSEQLTGLCQSYNH